MTDVPRWQPTLTDLRSLSCGAGVIIRHPEDQGLKKSAYLASSWGRKHGNFLFVSRSSMIARKVSAAGIHLSEQQLLRPSQWYKPAFRKRFLYSAACHTYFNIRRAKKLGVTFTLLSPVRATASHPTQRPLGIYTASHYARRARLPVYALGGMTLAQQQLMKKKGFYGIAGVGMAAKR